MASSAWRSLISLSSGRNTRILAELIKFFQVMGKRALLMINVRTRTIKPKLPMYLAMNP